VTNKDEDLDRNAIAHDFATAVNMSSAEVERWLKTDESRSVGWTHEGEHEAVGHHMQTVVATCTATWRIGVVRPRTSSIGAGATCW
jgi:hypothetical protein